MTTEQDTHRAVYIVEPGGGEPISGQGVRIKASTQLTGGQASVLEIRNAGFGGPPLHVHHGHDEMFYVAEGEYLFQTGGEISIAPVGTFAFFPRGTAHTFASRGDVPGLVLNIGLPSGLEKYVQELDRLMAAGADEDAIQRMGRIWDTELVGPPIPSSPRKDR